MAKTAKSGRSRDRSAAAAAVAVLPEALILWDILIRLPAKDLLRCRAWRRLTTAADFLLAHHRWQPSLPLVFFLAVPSWLRNDRGDAAFDALDLRRRPTKRQPVLRFNDNTQGCTFDVCVSCDGLILLSASNGRFYICNPATRQWAALPKLNFANVAGMYSHSSTGEYRVLYWTPARTSDALDTVYYVLTVGSSAGAKVHWAAHSLIIRQVVRWRWAGVLVLQPVRACLVARLPALDRIAQGAAAGSDSDF
jgi:hypothetical protein